MLRSLVIVASILLSQTVANAARTYPEGAASDIPIALTVSSAAFSALAINTAKTFDEIEVHGYRFLTLRFDLDHTAATAVTMTCSEAAEAGGTYRTIQVLTAVGSTYTSETKTWSKAVSGDASWPWTVRLNGYGWLKCSILGTGAGANDKVTLSGVLGN